jgi:hypothetical protein
MRPRSRQQTLGIEALEQRIALSVELGIGGRSATHSPAVHSDHGSSPSAPIKVSSTTTTRSAGRPSVGYLWADPFTP